MGQGRVVLITGGSRGIGRALVERFQAGDDRVASLARTEEGARAADPALALACDVADRDAVDAAVARVVKELGSLDVVVNNAGLAGENSLEPTGDDELWHRILDVNLNGTYYVTRAALPYLPDDRGRIIQVASVLGLRGVPDQTAYCAAKHAVVGFTRALAHKLAPRRIPVNAICPGWVATDMAAQRARELSTSVDDLGASVPLGRMVKPAEVAELAWYLASDAGAMITGQALPLDGGSTA